MAGRPNVAEPGKTPPPLSSPLDGPGLAQSRVVLLIHRDSFSYINVSQGTVATQLRCGEIFDNHFIAQNEPVKES